MAMAVSTAPEVDPYVISSENSCVAVRDGGRFNQSQILTYTDGTEWVLLCEKIKDRFCGFLYLQDALKKAGADKIKAAPNKMAIFDGQIIYLSQYCGEKKVGFGTPDECLQQMSTLVGEVGFTDIGGNANLREKDGEIFVFDTEKGSFAPKVHAQIDAFIPLHDRIRSVLAQRLQ
jgi:hypothetical protein